MEISAYAPGRRVRAGLVIRTSGRVGLPSVCRLTR